MAACYWSFPSSHPSWALSHVIPFASLLSDSLFTSTASRPIPRSVVQSCSTQKCLSLEELKPLLHNLVVHTNITHAWRIFLYSLIPKLYCNSLGTGLGVPGLLLHCLTCCTAGHPQSVLSVWVSAASQATGALPAPEEDPRWSVSEWTTH